MFGIVGAFRLHADMLNIFCISLLVLIVLNIIFIIVALVDHYGASTILWDFIVLALLVITFCFTADLRNAVFGTTILS